MRVTRVKLFIEKQRLIGEQRFGEKMRKRYNKTVEDFYSKFTDGIFYIDKVTKEKVGLDLQTIWYFRTNEMLREEAKFNIPMEYENLKALVSGRELSHYQRLLALHEFKEIDDVFKRVTSPGARDIVKEQNRLLNIENDTLRLKCDTLNELVRVKLNNSGLSIAGEELLKEASSLVGNPGTNISYSTDIACTEWLKRYNEYVENKK